VSPTLSVVLASSLPGQVPGPVLAALKTSCGSLDLELLLTGGLVAPKDGPPWPFTFRTIQTATGSLVPDQWGAGLRAATAPLVAFLTPDMQVAPAWWPALSRVITEERVAGAAGGIALADTRHRPDAGVFLARYSAFLPQAGSSAGDRADLPGEATVYRRDLLMGYPDLVLRGFWEVRFHERLRAEGWSLRFLPAQLAEFTGRPGLVAFAQQRCKHATEFGSSRVRDWGEPPWRVLFRAPAVPAVLVGRIVWRCMENPWGRRALPWGLAPLMLYSLAWAIGEVLGAFRASARR
jgi:hypothetical protein